MQKKFNIPTKNNSIKINLISINMHLLSFILVPTLTIEITKNNF